MSEGVTSILLRPAALLYGAVTATRNALFNRGLLHSWHAPLPVVSIGNITAGGTGKTPLVDWIVKYYLSIGERPAIVSRGYRRESKGVRLVSDGRQVLLGSREAGDEVAMLAGNNPEAIVVVAEKRQAGVEFILERFSAEPPSVVILDDAFQHRQISRDLDIVVVNAREPLFDNHLLPEGRLRETLSGLRRADAFLLGKVGDEAAAEARAARLRLLNKPVFKARLCIGELTGFAGRGAGNATEPENGKWLAFAGIASPESFLETLEKKGIAIGGQRFFGDHEPYSADTLRALATEAQQHGFGLVTTEKDWFRLRGRPEMNAIPQELPCRYLKVETDIYEGSAQLQAMLRDVVKQGQP